VTDSHPTAGVLRRVVSGWSGIVLGSLALAGLSLTVVKDSLAYDPYSWLIWGRELAHLHLDTRRAASAVKPLPMLLDAVFAFAGSKEPNVWLVLARAGTLIAFGGVFRLAWRLRGVAAGVMAVLGLAVSDQLIGYLFMRGMSEPMAAAAMVGAVDAFLLRRHRWAVGCLIAAAYLRAEAWPILLVYLVWLAWPHSWARRLLAVAVGIFVPFSWFLFDYFGAHQFLRSASAASQTSQGGPLLSHNPGLATFTETWQLASGPIVVLFVIGTAVAVRRWWRAGRPVDPLRVRPELVISVVAIAWMVVDAVLAQGRFATGAPRYLLPAEALGCVIAAVLVVDVVTSVRQRIAGPERSPAWSAAAALVVVAAFAAMVGPWLDRAGREVKAGVTEGRQFATLATRLPAAI